MVSLDVPSWSEVVRETARLAKSGLRVLRALIQSTQADRLILPLSTGLEPLASSVKLSLPAIRKEPEPTE